ncbi:urease accessory protein UreD [Duganella qianjiadongensis]|uniref:Urease accessory protein UreD n=1 Tax=Duganella qianjiadongensis TaxID=2692176 RepID=A0ABW9VGV7_9BURK|nr:urease accessory protein UreD [Duganella qianjiadongensis]MYM37808.1 urease accessory protein UreD [Duganella qianjiadongensis]
MPDTTAIRDDHAASQPWQASLTLGFALDGSTTRLYDNLHVGPLRVQKALYPEGDKVCHAIIVHPPGGVVGGDQLSIVASVAANAHALLATPGAAKWYKANGKISRQQVRLDVAAGGALEWLPQETIFFDTAHVQLEQEIRLGAAAHYLGCEILCMGRRSSGEVYASGCVRQRSSIYLDGKLIWWEQGALLGGQLDSPLSMQGQTVCATFLAAGRQVPAPLLAEIRNDIAADGEHQFGITQTRGVLVARHLGNDSETARRLMLAVWYRLRPFFLQRSAVMPRIWQT